AEQTAIIVCDVWDYHHCLNAVRRLKQFGPRLNRVLSRARTLGVTVIHSPSDCMEAYNDHPARFRAQMAPTAANLPARIAQWCSRIPSEEAASYPIDQSDGGEDDDPQEHARWAAHLRELGRNPGTPWKRQSDMIEIDGQRDFLSDRGDEVWNVLQQCGIRNVILTGVHTNMCVLGRPFGLRQMVRNGMRVALMRDMTDTMYNPQRWPFVSHFTGTDLVISHIERFVCPTISSDQVLGGKPFQFQEDHRPHLVIVMAEDGYQTRQTLPEFAIRHLGRSFRVSQVHARVNSRSEIPGLDVLEDADIALFSIRRRVLPTSDLNQVRRFVESGKPLLGLRTSSHAFALQKGKPSAGLSDWPEFGVDVFGAEYLGHHQQKRTQSARVRPAAIDHPLLKQIPETDLGLSSALYRMGPMRAETSVLWHAAGEDGFRQAVAWTYHRPAGGRSFYTSLGHPADFQQAAFRQLLSNALHWCAGLSAYGDTAVVHGRRRFETQWVNVRVPATWREASAGALADYSGPGWYRCVVRLPKRWLGTGPLRLKLGRPSAARAWLNGVAFEPGDLGLTVPSSAIALDDANLLVVKIAGQGSAPGLSTTPVLNGNAGQIVLDGRWQFRIGNDPAWSNMPLPAKFGTATDIVFEPSP
ncbi:MAG: ThuA domain-containing protein, partial [Planctomycetaceae bacterium]